MRQHLYISNYSSVDKMEQYVKPLQDIVNNYTLDMREVLSKDEFNILFDDESLRLIGMFSFNEKSRTGSFNRLEFAVEEEIRKSFPELVVNPVFTYNKKLMDWSKYRGGLTTMMANLRGAGNIIL
jgi:hypothetical protein